MNKPSRGEIWQIRLPSAEKTINGLVISDDLLNSGPSGVVVVLHAVENGQALRSRITYEGEKKWSIRCEEMRTVSVEHLAEHIDTLPAPVMQRVNETVGLILGLGPV